MSKYKHKQEFSNSITLYCADSLELMPELEPASCCVTDPPYGLSFMGKNWDHGVPGIPFWKALQIKSGGMVMAFGGTRTYHRLACAIEDAGFQIRDSLVWMYGSGFPKSYNISKGIEKLPENSASKDWEGYGTALKPAMEPITLAMKPLDGNFANNALNHGVAGLNIDKTRIEFDELEGIDFSKVNRQQADPEEKGWSGHVAKAGSEIQMHKESGRFPSNVILDETAAELLDEQTGILESGKPHILNSNPKQKPTGYGNIQDRENVFVGYGDSGGASRFFYTTKASQAERNAGCDDRNIHATVKPIQLMLYLVDLTTMPVDNGGLVIDPFMGSGTTGIACALRKRPFIGIEKEEKYFEIACARVQFAIDNPDYFEALWKGEIKKDKNKDIQSKLEF